MENVLNDVEDKDMYEGTKKLIDKLDKLVDWLEQYPAENKNEEFYLDLVQTRIDETKEESIFMLKLFES